MWPNRTCGKKRLKIILQLIVKLSPYFNLDDGFDLDDGFETGSCRQTELFLKYLSLFWKLKIGIALLI